MTDDLDRRKLDQHKLDRRGHDLHRVLRAVTKAKATLKPADIHRLADEIERDEADGVADETSRRDNTQPPQKKA